MKSVKKIIASMLLGVMVIGAGVQLPVSAMVDEQRTSQVQPNVPFKPIDKSEATTDGIEQEFEEVKLIAQLYNNAAEDFKNNGNISAANECYAEAKQATAFNEYIVWKAGFSNQEQCLEDMGKAAQFFKKAYRDYRNDGNNLKAHECYAKSLAAYAFIERANADLSVLEGKSAFENLEKAAKLFEKAAKALENIGDEKLATCFSQQSKEAYSKTIGKSLDRMS